MNQIIDNKYLILRELGGGGAAGSVYEASVIHDTEYLKRGERVAIKLYKPWVLAQPGNSYRIDQELHAGLNLSHPNIIKTIDLCGHGNETYLVMELLKGPTLRDWLNEHPKPTFTEIMLIASGIAKCLNILHQNGLVHRDIKPENIIVTEHRGPVVLDIGVIQNISRDTEITGQEFLGTIRYSAPEYLFGIDCTELSDVYSFGLIVLEMAMEKFHEDPEDYWSFTIVKKAQGIELGFFKFKDNVFSTKEQAFLNAIIKGCVGDGWTIYNSHNLLISRLSSKQLAQAFEDELWKKTFLYPVRKYLQPVSKIWPNIPNDVQDDFELFESGKKKIPAAGHQIIRQAAERDNGALGEIIPDRLGEEYKALYDELGKLGLLEWGEDNYGVGCWEEISSVAWQLVIRERI